MLRHPCLAALVPLVVAACMPGAPPSLTAPADPALSTPDPAYVSVTAGVKDYQPVGPRPWQELNRDVAPPPSSEGRGR